MNLIQRGTTASRANRGKSVMKSIAQRGGTDSYQRNWIVASLIPQNLSAGYSETVDGRI